VELVEKKLSQLESEKLKLNDATERIAELSQHLKELISESINAANSTTSVDEKINSLVGGLQSVMNMLAKYQADHYTGIFNLDNRISVLEEVLEDYIADVEDDLPQE